MEQNLAAARRYLEALEQGVTGPALAAFFTPDAAQTEYPNRLVPKGAVRSVPEIRASFAVFLTFRQGRIASQRNYDCFEPF